MTFQVHVKVNDNGLTVRLRGLKVDVADALHKGLKKGAEEISKFIKYDLLEGRLVNKRTGELQRGIYVRVIDNTHIVVTVRGPRKLVAEWIDQGLNKTWIIPAKPGKLLIFTIEGRKIRTHRVDFKGIKARYFMRAAAEEKRERVRSLVRDRVSLAIQKMQHA